MTLMHNEGELSLFFCPAPPTFSAPCAHFRLCLLLCLQGLAQLGCARSSRAPWLQPWERQFCSPGLGGAAGFLGDWEMGSVGGERARPCTSPERRAEGSRDSCFLGCSERYWWNAVDSCEVMVSANFTTCLDSVCFYLSTAFTESLSWKRKLILLPRKLRITLHSHNLLAQNIPFAKHIGRTAQSPRRDFTRFCKYSIFPGNHP